MQNSVDQSDVVREARRWVGTPFRHQGHTIGHGCDCVGIVRGVVEALNLASVSPEIAMELATYSRTPNPKRMGELLATFLTQTNRPRAIPDAYVAWLQWTQDLPMHLAITATYDQRPTIIHSLNSRGVVEHGFTKTWQRRVHSYWRLPGVNYG